MMTPALEHKSLCLFLTSEVGLNNDGSPAFLDEFQPQFPGQEVLLQVTEACQYRLIFCVVDPDPILIQPDPGRPKWYSKTGENKEISCLTSNLYGAERFSWSLKVLLVVKKTHLL